MSEHVQPMTDPPEGDRQLNRAQKRGADGNEQGNAKRSIVFRGITSGTVKRCEREPIERSIGTQTETGREMSTQTTPEPTREEIDLILSAIRNDNARLEKALREKNEECNSLLAEIRSLTTENMDLVLIAKDNRSKLECAERLFSDQRQYVDRSQQKAVKHQEEREDLINQIVQLKSAESSPVTVSQFMRSQLVTAPLPQSTPSRRLRDSILSAGRTTKFGRVKDLHKYLLESIGQLTPGQDTMNAIRALLKEYMSKYDLDLAPPPLQLSGVRSMQYGFLLQLSLNKYMHLKRLLKEDGIDYFASIPEYRKQRREWSNVYKYSYDEKEGTIKRVEKDLAKLALPKKRGRPPKNASMLNATIPLPSIEDINEKLGDQKEKRGRLWMANYEESLTHRIQNALDSDQLELQYDMEKDEYSCRIAFGGDKSGTTTKLSVWIGGTPKGNNVNNAMLLCVYQGSDNVDGLRDYASETFEQVDNVREITVTYCGEAINLKLDLYVIGDLNFFYAILGMGGAASNFNCPYCERKKGAKLSDQEVVCTERTIDSLISNGKNGEMGMKQGYAPLLNIHPTRFIPGAMHTVTGVFISTCLCELILAAKYADYQTVNAVLTLEEEDEDYEGELNEQRNVEKRVREYQENLKTQILNLTLCHQSTRTAVDQATAATEILSHIRDSMIDPPKQKEAVPRCASPFCLSVDKAFKRLGQRKGNKTVWDWVVCDSCDARGDPKDFHTACELVLSPEHILKLSNEDEGYDCLTCVHGNSLSINERMEMVNKVKEEEVEAIPKLEAKIEEKKKEQGEWSIVFTSKQGPTQKKVDETFEKKGASLQKYGQRVTGNHMRNLLKEGVPEELWEIVENAPNRDGQLALWSEFGKLQKLTTAHYLSDSEREALRACISEIQRLCALHVPHLSMSPKKHILFYHVMDIVDNLPCWGELSDQGVEAVNQDEKRGIAKFGAIRGQEGIWRQWAKDRERKNVMHDMGLDCTD